MGGRVEELSRDVFGVICSQDDSIYNGFGANQGFVLLEDSVLVFDSGFTNEQARAVCRAISSVTDLKVRYLVNSHYHSDHIFGNCILTKRYQSMKPQIISSSRCRSQIKKNLEERLAKYKAQDSRLAKLLEGISGKIPNIAYSSLSVDLTIEGKDILLIHPPTGAHTLGDTLVYLKQEKVLFAGDVVSNGFIPNLEDANLEGWIELLELLPQSVTKCLPGHGEPCENKGIEDFSNYLREVRRRLLQFISLEDSTKRGLAEKKEEAVKCFAFDSARSWKLQPMAERNADTLLKGILA